MAIIGLLSDSHGRAAVTRRAVDMLVEAGAQVLIHLGDVGSESVIDALAHDTDEAGALRPPVHLVFGNTDWNADELSRYARELGMMVADPMGRLELDGKVVMYTHGHLTQAMRKALSDGVDYLCHGHSHVMRDERIGSTRIINPGALHRAARYTAALLDTCADSLKFVQVDGR